MKNNLNIKILKAIQKGVNEALSNYDLTVLDDDNDSVLVKNDTYKRSSIYDDLIDKFSEYLDDDKIFKNIVEKMLVVNRQYTVKDEDELILLINKSIKVFGNECDLNWIDTSHITNMSDLFYGMKDFNGHIEKWDVSNVKNMNNMFYCAKAFNQPIGDWDVSNVEDMFSMFSYSKSFNKPLNNWDVSNVEDMGFMFYGAESFNQPLNNWDINNAVNMESMFEKASSFNQPLNNWNISSVVFKDYMFVNCPIKDNFKPKK